MSIINDALNKAREERNRKLNEGNAQKNDPIAMPAEASVQTKTNNPDIVDNKVIPVNSIAIPRGVNKKILAGIVVVIVISALSSLFAFNVVKVPFAGKSPALPQQPAGNADEVSCARIPVKSESKKAIPNNKQAMAVSNTGFVLSGIVYDPASPMAIINDSVCMIGDDINKSKVVRITEDTVYLEQNGRTIELKVR